MRFEGNAGSTSTLSPACFHQHHAHGPPRPPRTPTAPPRLLGRWVFLSGFLYPPPCSLTCTVRWPGHPHASRFVFTPPPPRACSAVGFSALLAARDQAARGPRETQLVGGQARSAAGAPAAMRSEAGERRTRHVARLVGDCPAAPAPTTATGRKEGEARQPSGGSRRQRSTGAGGSPRMRCRDAGLCACGDSGEGERLPRPLGLRTHRERERGERPRRRRSGRRQSPQVGEPGQKGRGRLDRARLGLGLGLGGRAGFRGTLLGSPRARGEGEAGEQWPGLKEGMGWWGSPRGRAASRAGEARSVGRGEEERFP